jgi:hypothetical protein
MVNHARSSEQLEPPRLRLIALPNFNLVYTRPKGQYIPSSKHSQKKLDSVDSSSTQFSERQRKREYISDTDTGDSGEF